MGSFSNTIFSLLLGWLQGLISLIWSVMTDKDGNTFLEYIGKNWIIISAVLCLGGLVADFAVYFFRWAPYKVWRTFWRHLKGRRDRTGTETDENVSEEQTAYFTETDGKTEEEVPGRSIPDLELKNGEEPDDLRRWRVEENDEGETIVPETITKAGYRVSENSPYRKHEKQIRKRRLRINLLGDSESDSEIHFYSPRPMVDRREAYHAPVYPEKWTGDRGQDS